MKKAFLTSSEALLMAMAVLLSSCASAPVARTAAATVYRNSHSVQFEYPSRWQVMDMSKNFATLAEAEEGGSAYIQVFSYDPMTSTDSTEDFSPTQAKIEVMIRRNVDKLDYKQVLASISDRLLEKSVFSINGNEAYRVHYWIPSTRANGRLDILAIEYLDQDLYTRFICYPWNSVHVKEFEALARSFRYNGK